MWPFRKQRRDADDSLKTIDQAIDFVAQRWRSFIGAVKLPAELGLRERVAMFARSIDPSLHSRFTSLVAAPEEVMLLIIAKGVEQSGVERRQDIERELGILLPP